MKLIISGAILLSAYSSVAAIPQKTDNVTSHYLSYIKVAFDSSKDMNERWKALMSAAELKKVEATPELIKASADSQWFMKNAAMVALSEYNPIESEKLAKHLIKDKALVVRSAAVDVLAKSADPEARKILWKELSAKYNFKNAESLWIRPQIVAILIKHPQDQELASFHDLLKESDLNIQLLAVQGLEKITGVKLGVKGMAPTALVKLWKDHKIN
jgi:HEAT repeat protein